MNLENKIIISVIIPSYNSSRTIRDCLISLIKQKVNVPYEILVVDSSSDQTAELIAKEFPTVKLIKVKERIFAGQARNIGVKESQGEIIACLDADCLAEEDWLQNIYDCHQGSSFKIIGGSLEPANKKSLISWAEYFLQFSEFFPQSPARVVRTIPMSNISYQRDIFIQYGQIPDIQTSQDTYFHWLLKEKGEKIYFSPQIKVKHQHREKLISFLQHQYHLGQGFTRGRYQGKIVGIWFLKYHLFWFLPFMRLFLTIRRLVWQLPWSPWFILSLPFYLIGLISWTSGVAWQRYFKK